MLLRQLTLRLRSKSYPLHIHCQATLRKRWLSSSGSANIYDVVCIGGGPAGLSLLTALRSSKTTSDLKVALIESRDLTGPSTWALPSTRFSNRASSLTPSSKRFLESINAWSNLDLERVQPYYGMQVWDGVTGSRIEFDWQSRQEANQDPTIAYMTENDNLVKSLITTLTELGGADIFHGIKVDKISLGPQPGPESESLDLSSWPHVQISNGHTLAARLLVGADGLNSPVRSFAGIESLGWDYDRHGVVATLRLAGEPDSSIAYQRFLPTGPIALLPLPRPYATLVWSTTPDRAATLKSLSSTDFSAMVNAAFRLSPVDIDFMHSSSSGQVDELYWRLQHVPRLEEGFQVPYEVIDVQEQSIASFPLRYRHADTYATHRVALVGDAAHTIHPLAGQGLNMGLGDVQSLTSIIQEAVTHGQDLGDQITLEAYNADRYEPNHRLMGIVDKLHKLYSYGSGPLVGLRSVGLSAINAVAPVKEFLMRQAAGGSV